MDHPFIATLTRSGPVGQTILAALLVLSVYTWAIILWKSRYLAREERTSRAFLARFAEAGVDWLHTARSIPVVGGVGRVYAGGVREYRLQRELAGPSGELSPEGRRRIEAALETEVVESVADLERGHIVLAIAASASPFIGLFGTVWGIMNAFRGMSLEGSAGIAAVAPGVAEALVTTVAGLAVAIPAVVAFNLLTRKVRLVATVLDRFSGEFIRAIDLAVHRSRAAGPVPGAESTPPVFARHYR